MYYKNKINNLNKSLLEGNNLNKILLNVDYLDM
jgi:hypothetical protein